MRVINIAEGVILMLSFLKGHLSKKKKKKFDVPKKGWDYAFRDHLS